jgi:hypothetical protein
MIVHHRSGGVSCFLQALIEGCFESIIVFEQTLNPYQREIPRGGRSGILIGTWGEDRL